MLDINLIRTQPDLVKTAIRNRQDPALAEKWTRYRARISSAATSRKR